MATNNSRDVKMTLAVNVTGAEDVTHLGESLGGVAAAGTAAAPGVEKLAAELAALTERTKELRIAEAAAKADLAAQKTARAELADALARMRAETDKSTRSTDEYRAKELALRLAIIEGRGEIRAKQAALASATTGASVAAAAEASLAAQIKVSTDATHAQIQKIESGVTRIGGATEGVSGILRQFAPLMAAAFSAQQFLTTITAAESLSRSYEQVFGSTAKARAEMEFIKITANKLGLETLDLAKSYQALAASTRGTVLEGQATRDVFEAVARAMSTLGKSTAETERALVAVSQIASKGTASMEELRGQLGEALPGAMKAAADGAGLTVEQLVEMVSSGTVLAKDILPALTKGLNDLYGNAAPPSTVISEWARLKNVITDTSVAIGNGGASEGIAKALIGVATAAKYGALGVDILGTSIGEGVAALVTMNGSLTTSQDLAKKYGIATVAEAEAADKATAAHAALIAAQNATGTSAQQAGAAQDALAKKTAATVESFLAVKQKYGELAKGSADYVLQVEKEVAARGAESNVLTQLVGIFGTEIEKRQVAVGVAQTQAAAAEKLAAARNTEALIAASYVIKLKEQALATGDVTEATKKQIEESQKSAAAKQTEFERTDALAKSKRIEAEATKAQAQALQDNSARVYEYRAAVTLAAAEVERLTQLHKEGRATEKQLTEALTKLADATLLYRDALADATLKAERNIAVQQQASQLAQASISVDLERVKAAQEVAAAQGDGAKVAELATQATNLQVQASRAQAEAARGEATAIRAAADARETELKAQGLLTDAAQAEIAARRQSATLKDLEAQKADILTTKILALADANKSETASIEAKNAALERTISAQEKAYDLAERTIALENRRLNRDKEGFALNTAGQRVNMQGETQRSVYENAKGQGLTEAQSLKIAEQFIAGNGQQIGANQANTSLGENWGTELQKAINKVVLDNARATAGGGGFGPNGLTPTAQAAGAAGATPATAASPTPTPQAATGTTSGSTTHTVNISLGGGKSTGVNVASAGDATALKGVLRQLESASGVSA